MTIQKNIKLQVRNSVKNLQPDFATVSPANDYDIHIQVANGWAITGHYHNQVLQTITLQKTSSKERLYHG